MSARPADRCQELLLEELALVDETFAAQVHELRLALEEMQADGLIRSEQEARSLVAARLLQPFFDSGIVYQAIAEELIHLGFKSRLQMKAALARFPQLPAHQKKALVDGIYENILHALGGDATGPWRTLEAAGARESKLVLLNHLQQRRPELDSGVLRGRRKFFTLLGTRTGQLLRPRVTPLRSRPNGQYALRIDSAGNIIDEPAYGVERLEEHLAKLGAPARSHFVVTRLRELSADELEVAISSGLGPEAAAAVTSRLQAFERVSEITRALKVEEQERLRSERFHRQDVRLWHKRIGEAHEKLAALKRAKEAGPSRDAETNPELAALEKRLWETDLRLEMMERQLAGDPPPSSIELIRLQAEAAGAGTPQKRYIEILFTHSARLTSEQFTALALEFVGKAPELKRAGPILELYRAIRSAAGLRGEAGDAIKEAMLKQAARRHLPETRDAIVALTLESWSKPDVRPRAELIAEKVELERRLKEAVEKAQAALERQYAEYKQRVEAALRDEPEAPQNHDARVAELKRLLDEALAAEGFTLQ